MTLTFLHEIHPCIQHMTSWRNQHKSHHVKNPWWSNHVPHIHKTDDHMILINYDMKALQGHLIVGWEETNLVKSTPAGAVRLQFCGFEIQHSTTPVTVYVKHKFCGEKSSSLPLILHLGIRLLQPQPLVVCHWDTKTALNKSISSQIDLDGHYTLIKQSQHTYRRLTGQYEYRFWCNAGHQSKFQRT